MPVKTNNFPFGLGFELAQVFEIGVEDVLDCEFFFGSVFFEEPLSTFFEDALFVLVDLVMQKTKFKKE